jgi:hypothetical protein
MQGDADLAVMGDGGVFDDGNAHGTSTGLDNAISGAYPLAKVQVW